MQVLEQAPELREVGAGLQLSPNGFAVMRALGLESGLDGLSVRGRATVLSDYRAPGEILRMDLGGAHAPGEFYYVHRADLIGLLFEAACKAGVEIHLSQNVSDIHPGNDQDLRPSVRLSDGEMAEADLIVGADGLNSRLRPVLNGEEDPFFTGQVAWRALVPANGNWPD